MGCKQSEFIGLQIPRLLDQALERAVRNGTFKTKSELVRTSLREKLQSLGYLDHCEVHGDA